MGAHDARETGFDGEPRVTAPGAVQLRPRSDTLPADFASTVQIINGTRDSLAVTGDQRLAPFMAAVAILRDAELSDDVAHAVSLLCAFIRSEAARAARLEADRDMAHTMGTMTSRNLATLADRFSEVVRAKQELELSVSTDPMTGLWNQRMFLHDAPRMFDSLRKKGDFAYLAIDLDGFKAVNDTLGHEAGDAVLVAVGALFKKLFRISDYTFNGTDITSSGGIQRRVSGALGQKGDTGDRVIRSGGDEFVVMLPVCDLDNAIAVGNRIVRAIRALEVDVNDMRGRPSVASVSASVGIAIAREDDDFASLRGRADERMYRIKTASKGAGERGGVCASDEFDGEVSK